MYKIGIIGLPNVGKSLLFNKLTKNNILSENFFFSNYKYSEDYLKIFNKEIYLIKKFFNIKKIKFKCIKIIDITSFIKDLNKNQKLNNKSFLKLKKVNLIIHIIRLFNNKSIYKYYNNNFINNINILKNKLIKKDILILKKFNILYKEYINHLLKNNYLNTYKNTINKSITKCLITTKSIIYLFNINLNQKINKQKIKNKIFLDKVGNFILDIKKNKKKIYIKFINYIIKYTKIKFYYIIYNNKINFIILKNNQCIYKYLKRKFKNFIIVYIIKYNYIFKYKNYKFLKSKLMKYKIKKIIPSNNDIIYIKKIN
ncbi:MAG: GTPase [Candidatus Shikimatogenerans sp. AspAUS03]|uniref:GTPase n=1 Tax=Candidatus Shikimatogenerans sp. AspAUS03 TaxID=3158563 RepID=A0AAU7QSK2_9FLAO